MQKMQEHFSALRRLKRLLLVPYLLHPCSRRLLLSYTFRTSNFGSALGGTGVFGKGFAYMDVFTAFFDGHPGAEF